MKASSLLFFMIGYGMVSCEINQVVSVYANQWQTKIADKNLPSNGSFLGLGQLSDGSILSIHRSFSENDTRLTFFKTSPDGVFVGSDSLRISGFSLDLDQITGNEQVDIPGQSTITLSSAIIISIESDLSETLHPVDLSAALDFVLPSGLYLSPDYLYLSGEQIDRPGEYSIVKVNRSGKVTWSSSIAAAGPVLLREGSDEALFALERDTVRKQSLTRLNKEGEIEWSVALTGTSKIIPDMERIASIYVSPSNTITAIGSNGKDRLMLAFIDPRGKYMFHRVIPGFVLSQYRDFLVTRDGGFFLALSGESPEDNTSFSLLRLNHRAVVSSIGEYVFNNFPEKVSLIELENRQVIAMTDEGRMVAIKPD